MLPPLLESKQRPCPQTLSEWITQRRQILELPNDAPKTNKPYGFTVPVRIETTEGALKLCTNEETAVKFENFKERLHVNVNHTDLQSLSETKKRRCHKTLVEWITQRREMLELSNDASGTNKP